MSGTTVDPLLVESAQRLFVSTCTFEAVQRAEADGWAPEIWAAVADAGFAWISLPEAAGGAGGTLADACEVLRVAGAHAAPIPLAETALLGGWLLAEAGLALPPGPVTVAPGRPEDAWQATTRPDGSLRLDGRLHRVPWADHADVLALHDPNLGLVVAVPRVAYTVEPARNMAGERRDTVVFDAVVLPPGAAAPAPPSVAGDGLRARGALSRVMLMAGAIDAMARLTVRYTEGRRQFGQPVSRFQAVQQHLVWSAQDAAIATMAAQVAARQASRGSEITAARFEIAAARVIVDESATTATRQCHQAHGAIGMTQEYALHHLSRRLWSWRAEWATPGEWGARVAGYAHDAGPDGLYPLITGGSAALDGPR